MSSESSIIPIISTNESDGKKLESNNILGVLPLKNKVLFPGVLLPVTVARPKSLKLVRSAFEDEKYIAVLCQKETETQDPKADDLYPLGTAARVIRTFDLPDGSTTVILEGIERIMVDEYVGNRPYLKARIIVVPEILPMKNDKDFLAVVSNIKDNSIKILQTSEMPPEASFALKNIDNAPLLVNYICVNFNLNLSDKQSLLQQEKLADRAFRLLELLNKELQMLEIKQSIQNKAREDINKQQREYFLEQQIKTIQKELGDTSEKTIKELEERGKGKQWSAEVAKVFEDELHKLERIPSHSPDYSTMSILRTILTFTMLRKSSMKITTAWRK